MPKATLTEIDKRVVVKVNKQDGILSYDIDNAYPQRVDNIISNSGTATLCVKLYSKFIQGAGFADAVFAQRILNRKKQTSNKVRSLLSEDLAKYGGYAIHYNFNGFGQIVEVNYLPFKTVRFAIPDDKGFLAKYAVYHDWGFEEGRMDKKKMAMIDAFNPDPEIVLKQIELAGGIENYKGQVKYYPQGEYVKAPIDPVLEDAQSEAHTKTFKFRNITTNFLVSHILITNPIENGTAGEGNGTEPDGKETKKFHEALEKFQGADNANKILHIERVGDEEIEIKKFDVQDNETIYQYTETSIQENIRKEFLIPKVFFGDVPGGIGSTKIINDAIVIYNNTTDSERKNIQGAFEEFAPYWHEALGNDFTMLPLSTVKDTEVSQAFIQLLTNDKLTPDQKREISVRVFGYSEEDMLAIFPKVDAPTKQLLIQVIGIGGVTALITVLTDQKLTPDQKKNTLVIVFGITIEEANVLTTTIVPPTA